MRKNKLFIPGMLTVLALVFASCQTDSDESDPEPPVSSRTYSDSVQKVTFTGNTANLSFDKLNRNDVYLVKINTSGLVAPAGKTGRALNVDLSLQPDEDMHALYTPIDMALPQIGHPGTQRFSANLPPITEEMRRSVGQAAFAVAKVGDVKTFWVETYADSGICHQKPATLRATGKYGNIWIMNDNRRAIAASQAETLAAKFDLIYPLATNLLGFEYGGGPGGDGGRDGDPKIQILVYDILDARGNVAGAGYFHIKDFFSQSFLDNTGNGGLKTSLAEIFYIDAGTFTDYPDDIYTVLVHEFQHMINFNVKTIQQEKESEAWYTEMLSTMAEDVISPLIGVASTNQLHPISSRIPRFLGNYNRAGLTEWDTSASIYDHYAVVFAFGAYLMRNYGGPALLREILASKETGIDSITQALQKTSGVTFEQAFSRYGEALVFSGTSIPKDGLTFDKTASSTVSGNRYVAYAFDIWSMSQEGGDRKGPLVFDLSPRDMRPHSILIQSSNAWRNVSGSISITLERPDDESIEFYLIVR